MNRTKLDPCRDEHRRIGRARMALVLIIAGAMTLFTSARANTEGTALMNQATSTTRTLAIRDKTLAYS